MTAVTPGARGQVIRRAILGALFLGALPGVWAGQNNVVKLNMQNINLWQLIDVLTEYPSFAPSDLSTVLPVGFVQASRRSSFTVYRGGAASLAEGVELASVEVRSDHEDARLGLISIQLTGICVTLAQVREHYPDIVLSDTPRGRSLEEVTGFSAVKPWGKVSFGFKERNRECLATVTIDRVRPV